MELRQLEHFVTVAEERHFTRAAELLRISQSGLSASIRSLEQELGTSLFVRSTRRVELTAAGQALLADSVRTLASAAAARDAVAAVRGLVRGRLTIGAEPCLGSVDLPAELAAFRTANPGVEVRLRYSGSEELVDDVAGGRADVALVVDTGPRTGRGAAAAGSARRRCWCSATPEHRFAAEQSIPLERLRGEPLVGFQEGWGAQALDPPGFRGGRVRLPRGDGGQRRASAARPRRLQPGRRGRAGELRPEAPGRAAGGRPAGRSGVDGRRRGRR